MALSESIVRVQPRVKTDSSIETSSPVFNLSNSEDYYVLFWKMSIPGIIAFVSIKFKKQKKKMEEIPALFFIYFFV